MRCSAPVNGWARPHIRLYAVRSIRCLTRKGRTAEAVTYLEQNVALDEAIGHPDLESDRATLERVRDK